MIDALPLEDIQAFVREHPHWRAEGERALIRTVKTEDYADSLRIAGLIGELAEKLEHHPPLTIEWGKLVIVLTTHDAGNRVSERDIDMARKIDSIVGTK